MRFSLAWLLDHLDDAPPADELARGLTAAGFNVELREAHGDDEVWDVEVTTNRPDAMNHRGLAREAAAAGCGRLRPLAVEVRENGSPVAQLARLTVEDAGACPRYCARVIRNVTVGPSPPEIAERLERCGVRPINAVVDATNYVMLDLGQPLHAFDLATLHGAEIRVRRARRGETLTTLDEVERKLDGEDLLITDGERAVALAGIMGGSDTEITERTTAVLLESANFDALVIRRMRRRLGLATEASHRFERGADRAMARTAVDAAAALIARLAGGDVALGVLDSGPDLPEPRRIVVSPARLSRFAGCEIPSDEMVRILTALELAPERVGEELVCTVPTHRVDLEIAEDLYEEVLRHYGYDNIPAVLPNVDSVPGSRLGSWPLTDRARNALAAAGLAEAFTYSFVPAEIEAAAASSPLAARGEAVRIANPLSARMAVMRRSLVGGMVEAAGGNLRRGAGSVALGEVGRVFFAAGGGIREEERLGVVMAGRTGPWDGAREVDFLDLKGVVETIAERLGLVGLEWRKAGSGCAVVEPEAGAELVLDGAVIGVAGLVARRVAALLDLPAETWVAELDLDRAAAVPTPRFMPVPRFPPVIADLTVRHPVTLTYAALTDAVRSLAPEWLEGVEPVVRYRGEGVGGDEVKTTLRLTYRHGERSLTQEEVNEAHFTLMERLAEQLRVSFT